MFNNAEKISARSIVASAGPRRWIVIWLYRLRMMGWVFFAITFVYILALNFLQTAFPKPVIVINEHGRIVGKIDFLSDLERTDDEYIYAAMHYLTCKLSRNSETINEDISCALNMTTKDSDLYKQDLNAIITNTDIKRIENLGLKSRIEFSADKGPSIFSREHNITWVRAEGNLVVNGTTRQNIVFNAVVGLVPVQRLGTNLIGIEVTAYELN